MNAILLDIVCHPTAALPLPHRLAFVQAPSPAVRAVRAAAGGATLENALVWRPESGADPWVIAIPDVDQPAPARIEFPETGEAFEFETGPVEPFEVRLMPSTHLCFGFFSNLPEHEEAARIIEDAVAWMGMRPDYAFDVEFMRGLANYLLKYPGRREDVRRAITEGRLGVSALWSPSFFEHFDGESQIRQVTEAQWWLRRNFGRTSNAIFNCDAPGFDPQHPQILRQCGVEFYWKGRYGLYGKPSGSPLIDHRGIDGSSVPAYVTHARLSDVYICPKVNEMWVSTNLGGPPFDRHKPASRASPGFGTMLRDTQELIRNTRELCGVNFSPCFAAHDQLNMDRQFSDGVDQWNAMFQTPRLVVQSMVKTTEQMKTTPAFTRDRLEDEHPGWAPFEVAGCRQTIVLQEAAQALCTAEKAAVLDRLINSTPYPADELRAAWLNVLGEQQHEQLGHGAEILVQHAGDVARRAAATANDITQCAARRIAGMTKLRDLGRPVTVFNFLNWSRRDAVEVEGEAGGGVRVLDGDGQPVPAARVDGKIRLLAEVGGMGYRTYYLADGADRDAVTDLRAAGAIIENAHYRLEVDPKTGSVCRLRDKQLKADILSADGVPYAPFEPVVLEDNGKGYCLSWPTGKTWHAGEYPGASVRVEVSGLSARLIVERPLFAESGDARFGRRMVTTYELLTGTRRLDVSMELEWDSPHLRELRWYVPVAFKDPAWVYDTLFSTTEYDPDLPKRQQLLARFDPWGAGASDKTEKYYDWRNVTRFASAYDAAGDRSVSLTVPQALMRVEQGGVSFTVLEERTDSFWTMMPSLKGRHVFSMSLTSGRGDWRANKAWRLGWERRSGFNPLVAVTPEPAYPVLPDAGTMLDVQGENLVLTALKQADEGDAVVARVYDAAGQGDEFGMCLRVPYAGFCPVESVGRRLGGTSRHADWPERPLKVEKVEQVNLLEDVECEIPPEELAGGQVAFPAWGIRTFRLRMERPFRQIKG